MNMKYNKIGFIGLGLIGGSILKAVRSKHPDYHITAFSISQATLLQAKEEGMLDEITTVVEVKFGEFDYIFLFSSKLDDLCLLICKY